MSKQFSVPKPEEPKNSPRLQPKAQDVSAPKLWTFSFRYFGQMEYFGLSKTEAKWFVSLVTRLGELSKYAIDDFLGDNALRDNWRYHDVNWGVKNIPVQRSDFNWLPAKYLNNDIDYPFVQFMVSKSLGRVVGFWDEFNVFNVVVFDPFHNIWPTKRFNYRVDPCSPASCSYSSILADLDFAKEVACHGAGDCRFRTEVLGLPRKHAGNLVVFHLPDDYAQMAEENSAISHGEIYLRGLLSDIS